MKKNYYFLLFLLFAIGSCETTDVEKDPAIPTLILEHENLDFEKNGATKKIKITSTGDAFEITEEDDWCTTTYKDKLLTITVSKNDDVDIRTTSVSISYSGLSEKITIRQLGQSKAILINQDKVTLERDASEFTFEVTSNIEYEIETSDWVKSTPKLKSSMIANSYTYSVDANHLGFRLGDVIVSEINDGAVESVLRVVQKGYEEGDNPIGDDIKNDILIPVVSGVASSTQGDATIELTFDGNFGTGYHSSWSNTAVDYFPITLEYTFESQDIDYIIYYPPNSHNGPFKEVEIYATTEENSSPTKIQTHLFNGGTNPSRVILETPLRDVTSITFKVLSGVGDGQGFAACVEMEFFRYNPDKFDPLSLFTDSSCSELKSGITLDEIMSCKYGFYLRLAHSMFENKYAREFRIGTYKAFMNPNTQREEIKQAFAYSLLDNPTGIRANTDEELVVFVGDTYGAELSIKVQNLDVPGGNGYYNSSSYLLVEGQNKIKVRNSGLIYLFYHSDEPETKKPVTIHFATGDVNGYFDSQKHTEDDWARLINGAVDSHFDLVGRYAHLSFPTADFKMHTTNGKTLIDLWDVIVKKESELMGLDDATMFKNRMYCHVVYDNSYMYATSHRTAYHKGTISTICNEEQLKSGGGVWGPAHEIGHCNQTVPDLKWVTMTEVTNNIFALHVQRHFGNISRLEAEDRYAQAHAKMESPYVDAEGVVLGPHRPYPEIGNPFEMLVPFWQLYLYFDLDETMDFYPDLHKMMRANTNPPQNSGECALQLVRFSCIISGYNLLDFFEYWGFLTPIDKEYDDYGVRQYLVTQEQIDTLTAEIEAANYKTPKDGIWNITDQNVGDYR